MKAGNHGMTTTDLWMTVWSQDIQPSPQTTYPAPSWRDVHCTHASRKSSHVDGTVRWLAPQTADCSPSRWARHAQSAGNKQFTELKPGANLSGQRVFLGAPVKTLKLAIFILFNFDFKFGFKSIVLVRFGNQFLINKHKNRGRFWFTGAPEKHSLPRFIVTRWNPVERALLYHCFYLQIGSGTSKQKSHIWVVARLHSNWFSSLWIRIKGACMWAIWSQRTETKFTDTICPDEKVIMTSVYAWIR
jgi:hypothetical protein